MNLPYLTFKKTIKIDINDLTYRVQFFFTILTWTQGQVKVKRSSKGQVHREKLYRLEPFKAELNKKTGSNIPMNIIKDKRELFMRGIFGHEKDSPESIELLDGNDREEYSLMIGEWTTNETTAPQVNKIFDHFREKLFEIINPPPPPVNKETWPLRLGLGTVLNQIGHQGSTDVSLVWGSTGSQLKTPCPIND